MNLPDKVLSSTQAMRWEEKSKVVMTRSAPKMRAEAEPAMASTWEVDSR